MFLRSSALRVETPREFSSFLYYFQRPHYTVKYTTKTEFFAIASHKSNRWLQKETRWKKYVAQKACQKQQQPSRDYITPFSINVWQNVAAYFTTHARCLKITGKVSFNITSEASYVYILSRQKLIKNAKNCPFWRVFEN